MIGLGMFLDVAQSFLDNPEQENLCSGKENLFVPGDGEVRFDAGLSFLGLEVVGQCGNQLHLVVMERSQIEDDLPGFLDGQFQLRLAFFDRGKARFRVFAHELLAEVQFEIDAGKTLHQPVMDFAGDAGPFFGDGRAGFFDVQTVE